MKYTDFTLEELQKAKLYERYIEGKQLSDKYDPLVWKGMLALFLFGMLGLTLNAKFDTPFWSVFVFLFIPIVPALKATNKADLGARLRRSANVTFGSDDEEYEARI